MLTIGTSRQIFILINIHFTGDEEGCFEISQKTASGSVYGFVKSEMACKLFLQVKYTVK